MLPLGKQIINHIKQAHGNILITCGNDVDVDTLASGLVIKEWIEKSYNRVADFVVSSKFDKKNYSFLSGVDEISSEYSGMKKFIISLDISQVPLSSFSYDVQDKNLKIYLTPKHGMYNENQISLADSEYLYGLIIVLGSTDFSAIGDLYKKNTHFFHQTTVINIDHRPENEYFGQINMIDVKSSSVCENVFDLLQKNDKDFITPEIATKLLGGVVYKTQSFRIDSLKPQSVHAASALIECGADNELIINALYKQKTVSILQVWGKLLSGLSFSNNHNIITAVLSYDDLHGFDGGINEIKQVIAELLTSIPHAEIILLGCELKEGEFTYMIWSDTQHNSLDLVKEFQPTGTQEISTVEISGDSHNKHVSSLKKAIRNSLKR